MTAATSEVHNAATIFAVEVEDASGNTFLHFDYIDTKDIDEESVFDVSPSFEEAVKNSWRKGYENGWEDYDSSGTWIFAVSATKNSSSSRAASKNVGTPVGVWMKFEDDEDDEPSFEANTYRTDKGGFAIE
jgi:hypothetical protein